MPLPRREAVGAARRCSAARRAAAARGRPCASAPGATTQQHRAGDGHCAEQQRDFVPDVRVATVRPATARRLVTLPATTSAFAAANIFARASGYIDKRNVDIGDHVKAGELLAKITAPELDHQITQAKATLAQNQGDAAANRGKPRARAGHLAARQPLVKKGWLTLQQGDNRPLDAAGAGGRGRRRASQHRGPGSPNRGARISRRPIRASSRRSTASSPSATSMSAAWCRPMRRAAPSCSPSMQTNVIRTQVFVPQDAGVRAWARRRRGRACSGDSGSHVSRQGDADRRRACSPARGRC